MSDPYLEMSRADAARRLTDTCVVEYLTGRTVQNENTGREEPVYTTRFTSPCRVKDPGYADSSQVVAGQREALGTVQVHLPWDAPEVHVNDRVRITAIGPDSPARLLGKSWVVGSDMVHSSATATRITVKEPA